MTLGIEDEPTRDRVLHLAEVGSTNDEALSHALAGEIGPLWVRADVQTTGRGRLGRHWTSPKGNLHASLLLSDPAEPRIFSQLAHVAAIALAAAVRSGVGPDMALGLKWPNDLLANGAKVAGILIEGTRTRDGRTVCIIGCGVNCVSHPEGLAYETTDLSTAAGRPVTAETIFAGLRLEMQRALGLWSRGDGYPEIRALWLDCAIPVGTALVVKAKGVDTRGTFQGLDCDGRLLLRTPDGVMTIEAGDVVLDERSATMVG